MVHSFTALSENRKNKVILISILIASLFIRLYQLDYAAGFDFDQELAATQANKILEGDLTLIGQEVSVGGIFVGPFYNYLTALLLLISQGDPISIFYFQACLGIFTTLLMYEIGEQLQKNAGLVSAFIYTFSWPMIYIDRTAAPSNWLVFLTSLGLFCYLKYKFNPTLRLVLTTLVAGFAAQLHPVGVTLLVFPLGVLFNSRSLHHIKFFISASVLWIIWFTPLVLFDLRNNWLNLHGLFSRTGAVDYPLLFRLVDRTGIVVQIIIKLITYKFNLFLSGAVLLLWRYYYTCIKKYRVLVYGILLNTVVFTFYKGNVTDYYFLPAQVFALVSMGVMLSLLLRKRLIQSLLLAVVVVFLFVNYHAYSSLKNPYALKFKKQAVEFIKEYNMTDKPRIHIEADLGQNNGFTYLADYYQLNALFSHENPDFTLYLPKERGHGGKVFGQIRVVKE